MATDKRKRAIRALADKRGISYTAALRMHDAGQEQKPGLLQPASTDYHLGTVGLDLNRPMLMVGGGASGKTTIAATIAAQALERGMQVEFLSQGESGLEAVADALTPEEAMDRAEALSEELLRRARLYIHARKDAHAAYVSENPGLREKDIALDHHSVMNEHGIPPLLAVDDDMPKAIRTRSDRERYLSVLAEVTKHGRDYGVFLLSTRTDALDAFVPKGFMEQLGDVLFLGSSRKIPHSPTLNSTLKARGLDTNSMFLEMGQEGYRQVGKGIVTYDDYYEVVNLLPSRMESPAWDGNTDPDPLDFYLGATLSGEPLSVALRERNAHLLICGGEGAGKSTMAELVVAQALSRPMRWDPALHAEVYAFDLSGRISTRWSKRGVNCAPSGRMESILVRLREIEQEHQRRLKIISEHPGVHTWEDLSDSVKKSEHVVPIVAVLDDILDSLERPDRHTVSEEENEALRLLLKWRDEGSQTGITLVLTSRLEGSSGVPNTYRVFVESRRDVDIAERLHLAHMLDGPREGVFLPMNFDPNANALESLAPPA